jgi:hypothetical protein
MNGMQTFLIFATVAAAGIGPFVAVKRGGNAYEFDEQTVPEPQEPEDATTQFPRVTVETEPYSY